MVIRSIVVMHSDIPLCATAIHTNLSIGVRLDPSSLIKAFPTFSQPIFFLFFLFFCFVVHVWREVFAALYIGRRAPGGKRASGFALLGKPRCQ
jgi:hypothetical protein